MGLGPFDLTGGAFLTLYGVLLALVILAGALIPRWLRPEGGSRRVTDGEQLAYLAGGAARLTDAVVARLLAARALVMEPNGRFAAGRAARGQTAAERAVLGVPTPASLRAVQRAASGAAPAIEEALVRAGLLIEGPTALQLRLLQTAPYLLLLVFGAIKWEIGTGRGRPVGYLTALLAFTAIFALLRLLTVERRTRAGFAALEAARDRSDRLRRAPVAEETGMAVALFGTVVLSGSDWNNYHTLRTASSGGDGGSSGSDGGGSGCGGGGCGGCGS